MAQTQAAKLQASRRQVEHGLRQLLDIVTASRDASDALLKRAVALDMVETVSRLQHMGTVALLISLGLIWLSGFLCGDALGRKREIRRRRVEQTKQLRARTDALEIMAADIQD